MAEVGQWVRVVGGTCVVGVVGKLHVRGHGWEGHTEVLQGCWCEGQGGWSVGGPLCCGVRFLEVVWQVWCWLIAILEIVYAVGVGNNRSGG